MSWRLTEEEIRAARRENEEGIVGGEGVDQWELGDEVICD